MESRLRLGRKIERVATSEPTEVARIFVDIAQNNANEEWTASVLEGIHTALQSDSLIIWPKLFG